MDDKSMDAYKKGWRAGYDVGCNVGKTLAEAKKDPNVVKALQFLAARLFSMEEVLYGPGYIEPSNTKLTYTNGFIDQTGWAQKRCQEKKQEETPYRGPEKGDFAAKIKKSTETEEEFFARLEADESSDSEDPSDIPWPIDPSQISVVDGEFHVALDPIPNM
jgi:hypothetical protein